MFFRNVENETQPETSQTSASQTAETSQTADSLYIASAAQNTEQNILNGYHSGFHSRSQSDRLDVVYWTVEDARTAGVSKLDIFVLMVYAIVITVRIRKRRLQVALQQDPRVSLSIKFI